MIFARDIDPRRPTRGSPIERIEQRVGALAEEFFDESASGVVDDRATSRLANAIEHIENEAGLAGAGRPADQDMFRLKGFGHRHLADDQRALLLAAHRATKLPYRTEPRAADIFVGTKAPPRPREIEPGPAERRNGEQPRYQRAVEQVELEALDGSFC